MKRTLLLTLALLAALLIVLPLTAQAAEVAWDSQCLAFQSGYHDHDWRWQSEEPANCLHGKITHYKCRNCGNTCTVRDSTKGPHQFPSTWEHLELPTCTKTGTDIHFCTVCLNASETRTVPALGHQWDSGKVTTQPTCTAAGVKTFTCTRKDATGMSCGATRTESVPATGHKPQTVPGRAATCTDPGRTDGSKCSVCGTTLTAQSEIPALGHNWGAWKQDEPGTCIRQQLLVRKCTRCGAADYKYGDYGDHDWGEWEVTKEPTATEEGLRERVCKLDASHKEQEAIPATGEPKPETSKPELTVTLVSKNDVSYTPQTVFEENELVWVTGVVTNTGNVDIELYDYDLAISTGYKENRTTSETESSGYILKPGQSYEGISTWFIADAYHSFTAADVIPGTETETLYGKVTYTATVPGYKPGTKEVLCTGTGSATIGILKGTAPDDGPHPALYLECTWAPDAGEGKRYEGATVPVRYKVTNTGDCTLYRTAYHGKATDIVFPNGVTDIPELGGTVAIIEPGESWEYTGHRIVTEIFVEKGRLDYKDFSYAFYKDAEGKYVLVLSNKFPINVPLTYPDGTTPEEDKPGITAKWAYDVPSAEFYEPGDSIELHHSVTNTGNVPLRIVAHATFTFSDGTPGVQNSIIAWLDPSETEDPSMWYWDVSDISDFVDPATETEELVGVAPFTFEYIGYAPETFVSEDNPGPALCSATISRTFKVRKPGWEIPEESQLEVEIGTDTGFEDIFEEWFIGGSFSDPAGYQWAEFWATDIRVTNTGPVDVDAYTLHQDVTADLSIDTEDRTYGTVAAGDTDGGPYNAWGQITEGDVDRGYIEVTAQARWTDPDSGKNRTADSNVWHQPVISRTGLLLKKGAKAPANGEYFTEGEAIHWTLEATNNSREDITDVTITDDGATVGTFGKLAAGEKQPVTVPPHTVTPYEAEVVGYVTNYAEATGKDMAGIGHTWPSNPATVLTKKPVDPPTDGGGWDPLGPTYGVHPAVSIVKADTFGPPDGETYKLGEEAIFTITVTNTGDCELKNLQLCDSLAGFAPIGSLASLAPGKSHSFAFKYKVTQSNVDHGFAINSATLTYTFGDGIPGTPMSSNECKIFCGEHTGLITDDVPPFDPELLHGIGDDACSLTLDTHMGSEARYTLHACAEHAELARAAEDAVLNGDSAVPIWRAGLNSLYETLYAAASDEAKAALLQERAQYFAWVDALAAMAGDQAAAEELRLKCAGLCYMIHNLSGDLPDSLLNAASFVNAGMPFEHTGSSRTIGELNGSDAEVTETYAPGAARTVNSLLTLLHNAKSYDADDVFRRGQTLWQKALDDAVNPAYLAADKDARKRIAAWRIGLDSLVSAQRPFLELLCPDNAAMVEERLMNLYRNSALEEFLYAE